MELATRRRVLRGAVREPGVEYAHDVQLYRAPPTHTLTLHEFEALAIERLQALRVLGAVSTLKGLRPLSEEWRGAAVEELKKEGLRDYAKTVRAAGAGDSERERLARRRDHVSHFVLRLAYCRTEELRRWFLARELELFKARFLSLSPEGARRFLEVEGLDYAPMTADEKARVLDELCDSTTGRSRSRVETTDFYRVAFADAADLVRLRRVLVLGGRAHVPADEFVSVLASRLRAHLGGALAAAARRTHRVEADERLAPLLKGLHGAHAPVEREAAGSGLSPEELDAASVASFPLCMRRLHEAVRAAHHLKHGGRLQYGLFLKGAGLGLEDAMRFWRDEFTKLVDSEKFDKLYAYNIRYNYGKEGSRKNYSPYSCAKIINGSALGPSDCHGCPYRHSDPSVLKNVLTGYGTAPKDVSTIVDLAKRGHYQVACSKYFDIVHNVPLELGINHPNQYFEESRKVLAGNIDPNLVNRGPKENMYKIEDNSQKEKSTTIADEWDDNFDNSFMDTVY